MLANKSIGGTPSVVKMLVERAELSIYVDGMGPICKKAVWGSRKFCLLESFGGGLSNINMN